MNSLAVSLNHTHSMFLNPTSPDAGAQNVLCSGQSINQKSFVNAGTGAHHLLEEI